jgi:prephenate dehydrogenase
LPVVGIIGGLGQFGIWFQRLFQQHGCTCLIADRGTDLSNAELARRSDIVVVSVPIGITASVLEEIAPVLTSSHLVVELSSVKTPQQRVLAALQSEVLSLHPMFSPSLSTSAGQTCIVCTLQAEPEVAVEAVGRDLGKSPGPGEDPASSEHPTLSSFVKRILMDEGLMLSRMSIEAHDRMMAVVQGITHFQAIVAAHCMMALGVDTSESLKVASPVYRVRLGMIGRVLSQNPKLYAEIQIHNPYVPQVLAQLEASAKLVSTLVTTGDVAGFEREFCAARDAIGDLVRIAADTALAGR